MKFSTAFALLSTFVVSISAAAPPVPDVSNVECNCRGTTFDLFQVSDAIFQAVDNGPIGRYPHRFNNREGFTFRTACGNGPFYEFPILPGGVFTGGPPGPDRVVYNTNGTLKFCGCITHRGAVGNAFNLCTFSN